MSAQNFFQEVEHTPVQWRQYQLHVPLFYRDIRLMSLSVMAPADKVKALLPSRRMCPYRILPGQSTISITAYQYRDCDIEPYNEVSIGIPLTLDVDTPQFSGSLRKLPTKPLVYTRHLPVTTEIAREVGAEFAGYPKFVAEIEFSEDDQWLTCELREAGQHILTLRGRKLTLQRFPRYYLSPITYRNGYILRSEFVVDEREMGSSKNGDDIELTLGEHPIAEELRSLNLGRVLGYSYCPHARGILTPVFESFAG